MPSLLYIHGFLSSPLSHKAQQVRDYCSESRPDVRYYCPNLPPYPNICAQQLDALIKQIEPPVYLVGSSMGGFWATWLAECYQCKAVLINPAVDVMNLMPAYIDKPLKNYHNDECYILGKHHLDELASYSGINISDKSRYWLLAQEGDETLNYQLAVEKYQGCRQTIEPGGDHSFQQFERFLAPMFEFFEQ